MPSGLDEAAIIVEKIKNVARTTLSEEAFSQLRAAEMPLLVAIAKLKEKGEWEIIPKPAAVEDPNPRKRSKREFTATNATNQKEIKPPQRPFVWAGKCILVHAGRTKINSQNCWRINHRSITSLKQEDTEKIEKIILINDKKSEYVKKNSEMCAAKMPNLKTTTVYTKQSSDGSVDTVLSSIQGVEIKHIEDYEDTTIAAAVEKDLATFH